jgi:hypothetical protein
MDSTFAKFLEEVRKVRSMDHKAYVPMAVSTKKDRAQKWQMRWPNTVRD